MTTNASISYMEILQRFRYALKVDFDDELMYHLDGLQIGMNNIRSFEGGSIITVCSPGEQFDTSTDEILRRVSIALILLSRINHFNLKRFFSYCDRKKSLKLERTELRTGLLTILKLFNEQLSDFSSSWPRFTFYRLFLPAESQPSLSYFEATLYLAEIPLQSVRLMPVDRSLDEFIQHLDQTLSDSLRLCPELSQAQTATVFGQEVCRYIVHVLASPVLLFISPLRSYFHKLSRAKILRRLAIHFSSISQTISMINFIIYYIYFVSSSEANQLEVFWPLGSVTSIPIILYVYKFSSFHRKWYYNGNRVEQMF